MIDRMTYMNGGPGNYSADRVASGGSVNLTPNVSGDLVALGMKPIYLPDNDGVSPTAVADVNSRYSGMTVGGAIVAALSALVLGLSLSSSPLLTKIAEAETPGEEPVVEISAGVRYGVERVVRISEFDPDLVRE